MAANQEENVDYNERKTFSQPVPLPSHVLAIWARGEIPFCPILRNLLHHIPSQLYPKLSTILTTKSKFQKFRHRAYFPNNMPVSDFTKMQTMWLKLAQRIYTKMHMNKTQTGLSQQLSYHGEAEGSILCYINLPVVPWWRVPFDPGRNDEVGDGDDDDDGGGGLHCW